MTSNNANDFDMNGFHSGAKLEGVLSILNRFSPTQIRINLLFLHSNRFTAEASLENSLLEII